MLISIFELSAHQFGTILKSEALTFQSASMQPSPVKDCSGRNEKALLWVAKHQEHVFFANICHILYKYLIAIIFLQFLYRFHQPELELSDSDQN